MRTFLSTIFLVALSSFSMAGQWTNITSSSPAPAQITLVSSVSGTSTVRFTLPGFSMNEVTTSLGTAYTISIGKGTPLLEAGAPDLPKLTASLVIPDQSGMSVRVVASKFKDFTGILIAPSKGMLSRQVDPSTVPYAFGPVYSVNGEWPGTLAGLREPYIIRDVRGQTILANPFQYNPVTRNLRVYYELTLELYSSSPSGINPLTTTGAEKQIPRDFLPVLSSQFLNFDAASYAPLSEYGNLLVICYGPFMADMQPYVSWKNAEGYHTEMISKDSVGTTAAQIRTFIADYYNTKGLSHVLLVGDGPQIPTNTGGGLGGPSDNAYGYIVGSDHYSDVFVGRFSAETAAQVQTQVQRTLEYEQSPQNLSDDWLTTVIGIASDQGPGDDNEYDYKHIRNQQTQLLGYTYTANPELFDGSQGGNDAPGNPTPPMVASAVNDGAGLILYCGHGSNTSWGTSGFSNSNVSQLTNYGMLPFIWSVACVNGNFQNTTCFAEAWLRATKEGQPTGAIAFLGSTINQSWDPPMEGQDAMTDILAESDSNNIKRTFAGISINGCMKMIDTYGSGGAEMADTWTVFGDPTVMVRTALPDTLIAQYDSVLYITDSTLTVLCPTGGARVTLTKGDSIVATGLMETDALTLAFPALAMAPDTLRLVITAYNNIPVIDDLPVRPLPPPVFAGFTGVPTSVVPGHTVAFADTSVGIPTRWEWHFPGGNPEISYEQNPVVAYDSLGIFDVTLIAGDEFTTDTMTATGYIIVDWPTRTGEKTPALACRIYPNPCGNILNLEINSLIAEPVTITLFDLTGSPVWQQTNITGKQVSRRIDVSGLSGGIYFLKVDGAQGMVTNRVIIAR